MVENMGRNPYSYGPSHTSYKVLQCEAPKIAKLVYKSNNYMVYGIYNYSYWGWKNNKHN